MSRNGIIDSKHSIWILLLYFIFIDGKVLLYRLEFLQFFSTIQSFIEKQKVGWKVIQQNTTASDIKYLPEQSLALSYGAN